MLVLGAHRVHSGSKIDTSVGVLLVLMLDGRFRGDARRRDRPRGVVRGDFHGPSVPELACHTANVSPQMLLFVPSVLVLQLRHTCVKILQVRATLRAVVL